MSNPHPLNTFTRTSAKLAGIKSGHNRRERARRKPELSVERNGQQQERNQLPVTLESLRDSILARAKAKLDKTESPSVLIQLGELVRKLSSVTDAGVSRSRRGSGAR